MNYKKLLLISLGIFMLSACSEDFSNLKRVMVNEKYQTAWNQNDNIDSPAIWHGPNGEHWLLATAKGTHRVYVYNALNGAPFDTLDSDDSIPGGLNYPNGIWVLENTLFVVERDNHRVSVFSLPNLEYLLSIGEKELIRPYGMSIWKDQTSGTYTLYVTDNYLNPDESVPEASKLNRRVKTWRFENAQDPKNIQFVKAFGETTEPGMLKEVESIFPDPIHNQLLICDEVDDRIKVYDLEGNFSGKVIGEGFFTQSDPEGIFLYECDDENGYWFTTDQSKKKHQNHFHIFSRKDLTYIGTFFGDKTQNTDGITLSVKGFPGFENGAFFPVNDDGNVSAIDLKAVAEKMGISLNCY